MFTIPRLRTVVPFAALVAFFLVLAALLLPPVALAEDPFRLDSQVEDVAGVLGGRTGQVEAAIAELRSQEQVDLWVVFVDSFSGMGSEEWADETAVISDLGLNDALLAVAVEDRAYAYSVDQDFPLTPGELNDIMVSMVEPALSNEDWAGAAIAAAEGIRQTLGGGAPTTGATSPTSVVTTVATTQVPGGADADDGFPWGVLIAIIALALVAILVIVAIRRSRSEAGGGAAAGKVKPSMSLEDLRRHVSSQLVQTDDAVKTSTEEVGFAVAEFGEEQAAPFEEALAEARRELDAAFRLYRQYDANVDEQAQRQLLTAVLQHTDAANQALDGQAEHFDRLRDLEKRAPQVFADLEQKLAVLEARIPEANQELERLRSVYAPVALASVANNPQEAASRIAFSREQVASGREDLAANRAGEAAVSALAAQEAAAQAQTLLDGVDRLGQDLAEAAERIEAAIAETQRDIAEARAASGTVTGPVAHQLPALTATAEAAMNAAAQVASPQGGRDPLAALRHLEQADAALEEALVQVRDEQAQRAKAAGALERSLLAARSEISAADGYITTHRGAVGSEPRSLLAEAKRYYDQAMVTGQTDPVTAGKHAAVAYELASRALLEAQRDTEHIDFGRAGSPMGGMGGTIAGAIIGGILANALGGRGGGFRGGGFGGGVGGFGGGGRRMSRGGSFGPPSFGGAGTRMRRGGGGRF